MGLRARRQPDARGVPDRRSPRSRAARRGFAFASGLGAETTLLLTLRPGDHVVLADDVYGGTYRLLSKVLGEWGLTFSTVDLTDLDALRSRDDARRRSSSGSRPRRTRC